MFSKKQSDVSRRLLEKKMYLARERPDDTFDLSSCELKMIPDGTFSLVKVLLKKKLYFQQNSLQKLDSGGKLTNLQNIVLLDISSNQFKQLPNDIHELKCLQVLNASKNLLSKLPPTIIALSQLIFLNVEDNHLTELPSDFGKLQEITKLYLKNNPLLSLPKQLCLLKNLKELTISYDHIRYPTSDICKLGLTEIMRYLCKEEETKPCELVSDCKNLAAISHITPVDMSITSSEMNKQTMQTCLSNLSPSSDFDNRRKEENLLALELERQSIESRLAEQGLNTKANQNKQMLMQLAEEESRVCAELSAIQNKRKQERSALLSNVTVAEHDTAEIIKQILSINKSAKQIEKMEDMISANQFSENISADYSALSRLKRNEILASMQEMLSVTDNAYAIHTMNLNSTKLHSLSNHDSTSEYVEQILANKPERSRVNQRTEVNQRVLDECRSELLLLLTQLISEQQNRQKELRKRLEEMEQQKKDDQLDFWLVQYQRILDSKPPNPNIQKILNNAQCMEYLPNFQRHAITYSIMKTMTDDDLKEIGIHNLGARREILKQTDLYKMKTSDETKTLNMSESLTTSYVTPSAPEANIVLSDEITARVENECCICQDAMCSTIFLPCGHVCCCKTCSGSVMDCPLCRSNIHNRIQLHF
ncbi:Leucine-rich repeat-containing protein 69 [Schistosoma japonicum]|nr:Leucine-rich repeat-containing protein 69 [Schistosoma japonicum]KAH8859175.1 Leucine-rich repeat-containing protein 69 [Schistosoma japonicum]KAH8859177.1 Leucine-rich repeat-containing protein 69 [Schistosoma japonicum]